ncbi:uncharacterized protein VTP21DRAFT_1380 [Calcarisporiella thermophila]|uniref:uncharacterized protein n=1 Tax=Calcarisporiella thermophila TaxID=911321 RepID=UPI003744393F
MNDYPPLGNPLLSRPLFPNSVNQLRPYYVPPTAPKIYYTPGANDTDSLSDSAADVSYSRQTIKDVGTFALVKYLTTAVASPFEVAKTVLQCQYLPNEEMDERESLKFGQDYFSDSEDDLYANLERNQFDRDETERLDLKQRQKKFIRKRMGTATSQNSYQMPPLEGGMLDAIGLISKHPTEGPGALLKGQFASWIYEMLYLTVQPPLESLLNNAFDLYDDNIPLANLEAVGPNISTLVASHFVVGVLLSPLELVKTRMIIQTSISPHKKYRNTIHCLRTVIAEEGLAHLYLGPHLVPNVLYHILIPLLGKLFPLIIDRWLHTTAADAPVLYGLAELLLNTMSLLITLPLDTVRKRLHCQPHPYSSALLEEKSFKSMVQLSPRRYAGLLDCLGSIIAEEGEQRVRTVKSTRRNLNEEFEGEEHTRIKMREEELRRRRRKGWFSGWGVGGLYKGFSLHCATNLMLFFSQAVGGFDDREIDW